MGDERRMSSKVRRVSTEEEDVLRGSDFGDG